MQIIVRVLTLNPLPEPATLAAIDTHKYIHICKYDWTHTCMNKCNWE